jgi:hypothetical protein
MKANQDTEGRKLMIIDDQLFEVAKKVFEKTESRLKFDISMQDGWSRKKLENLDIALQEAQHHYLHNIIRHILHGNFYGLSELIIYDLDLRLQQETIFHRTANLSQNKEVDQYAILIDIYSERDGYPTGIDIAEGLDQSPFADRIAWLSVTGNISSELKPYPLIRKREIPTCKEAKNDDKERDTLFLWWGWLFDDFKLEDENIRKQSDREIVNYLRECSITTKDNVAEIQEDIYLKKGKGERKGGLAGNILEPVLWRIHEDGETPEHPVGKITNAFLKIKGDRREGKNLEDEKKFISSESQAFKFPDLYHREKYYYCMKKIEGTNFSNFIFEQIDVEKVHPLLEKILRQIKDDHQSQLNAGKIEEVKGSLVLEYIDKIKKKILDWAHHNKYFKPLVHARTLLINNVQYYNALYLCEILENTYHSRNSTYFPHENDYLKAATKGLKEIDASLEMILHGDLIAQNIFVDNVDGNIKNASITVLDPKGGYRDYLVDYYKLFSSFSGQGHLEYLVQNPGSKLAHFSVNSDINPGGCYYVCTPSIEDPGGLKTCQSLILKHIQEQQQGIYSHFEKKQNTWLNRFLLGLSSQYLCAPPLRDSSRFHGEMKFLYYRGVEILNEFFERMRVFTRNLKIVTPEVEQTLFKTEDKNT